MFKKPFFCTTWEQTKSGRFPYTKGKISISSFPIVVLNVENLHVKRKVQTTFPSCGEMHGRYCSWLVFFHFHTHEHWGGGWRCKEAQPPPPPPNEDQTLAKIIKMGHPSTLLYKKQGLYSAPSKFVTTQIRGDNYIITIGTSPWFCASQKTKCVFIYGSHTSYLKLW